MALSFHATSPLGLGPFVTLDCREDERRLAAGLLAVLAQTAAQSGPDPVRAAFCGTLFLDGIEHLSESTQKLLLLFAHRILADGVEGGWPVRLAIGSSRPLDSDVERGRFLAQLWDELDKLRVNLEAGEPLAAGAA